MSFVKAGLRDLSVSRTTFDWGVKLPGDPRHVMYVWVDALTNYLTGTGFPDPQAPRAKFWPASAHVIGKDITRFHAIYWPALLMSAKLALPRQIVVHGFLFNRGEKMSKSVGNVIDPLALAKLYGSDELRYFLLRDVPFGQDGTYSHEAIVNRINADLANDLGNLAQRSLSMLAKNCSGILPRPGTFTEADQALLAQAAALPAKSRAAMQDYALHTVLTGIWKVVSDANRYFASEEPWVKRKSDPARMQTILYVTAEVLRIVAIMAQPFVPSAMEKLLGLLSVPEDARTFAHAETAQGLVAESSLPAPMPVFPRYIEAEEDQRGPPC